MQDLLAYIKEQSNHTCGQVLALRCPLEAPCHHWLPGENQGFGPEKKSCVLFRGAGVSRGSQRLSHP